MSRADSIALKLILILHTRWLLLLGSTFKVSCLVYDRGSDIIHMSYYQTWQMKSEAQNNPCPVSLWTYVACVWLNEFFSLDRFSYCSPVLRPIHAKRKRSVSLIFVFILWSFLACLYTLIFSCLIFLAFTPIFVWCEQTLKLSIWNSTENVEYSAINVVLFRPHCVASIW